MTSTDTGQISNWIGHTLLDSNSDKIGTISDIYLDEQTGKPEWIAVTTGMFGRRVSFVPLAGSNAAGDDLQVPFTKDQVKDSPNAEADGQLSQEEEARIYGHYGITYGENESDTGLPEGGTGFAATETSGAGVTATNAGDGGHDTSGPNTDDAMTRSEEQVQVGTTTQETGRVRLRKYVETEMVNQQVPVRREKVTVEREPITDENVGQATSGPDISEEEHEIVLTEERPVVEKEVVPVERVRLGKETVTDTETVETDVRKERIELDDDQVSGRRNG
jgi:uncharacterized protein (TIGR02271 family)